ncbi:MAG: hypothetical protein RLZZ200_1055 [Pseudomonadota bacterium]|jgi:AraC-like DNA-binding protein
MGESISTDCVPPAKRLEFWRDAVCDVFMHLEVDVPKAERVFFNGSILGRSTRGRIRRNDVKASRQRVFLSEYGVSRLSSDSYYLLLQRTGRAIVEQGGRTAVVGPGEFALFRPTSPLTMDLPEHFLHEIVEFPGPLLRRSLHDPEQLCCRTVTSRGVFWRLLHDALEELRDPPEDVPAADAESLDDVLVALLCGALRSPCVGTEAKERNAELSHRERIRAVVREQLFDPELSVATIAERVNLSTSYVHRLFTAEGRTLGAWMWEQRLEASCRMLKSQDGTGRSITEVAHAVGFKDLAHFSRAFKSSFGCSPREYRQEVMAGRPPIREKVVAPLGLGSGIA